jgi:hypothetical protein
MLLLLMWRSVSRSPVYKLVVSFLVCTNIDCDMGGAKILDQPVECR